MAAPAPPKLYLSILDDDQTSRELLLLFALECGLTAEAAGSGDAELDRLRAGGRVPQAVLADMHMPGTTGAALARALRALCGAGTRLIAMSGSQPEAPHLLGFDTFLLKPFGPGELLASVMPGQSPVASREDPEAARALNPVTYAGMAERLDPAQLDALYVLCLEDTTRRLDGMRLAAASGDREAWVHGAHAIKGACGMVGALELAGLAGTMEQDGLPEDGKLDARNVFPEAIRRLQRILDALRQERAECAVKVKSSVE